MPPMAGLQLIAPTVSMFCVSSSVRAPRRAAASAASTPACPPPTTITSYRPAISMALLYWPAWADLPRAMVHARGAAQTSRSSPDRGQSFGHGPGGEAGRRRCRCPAATQAAAPDLECMPARAPLPGWRRWKPAAAMSPCRKIRATAARPAAAAVRGAHPGAQPASLAGATLYSGGWPRPRRQRPSTPVRHRSSPASGVDHDLILVDQRGTGRSHPLLLPVRRAADLGCRRGRNRARDARLPRAAWPRDHDLAQYTTSVAVRDLDAVRQALGYTRISSVRQLLWHTRRTTLCATLSGPDAGADSRWRRAADADSRTEHATGCAGGTGTHVRTLPQ